MAQTTNSISTSRSIRFPRETLAALGGWATLNGIPRSVAVRRLVLRSMTNWEDDPTAYCAECEGGTGACRCEEPAYSGYLGECDCRDGLDTCTGNCKPTTQLQLPLVAA